MSKDLAKTKKSKKRISNFNKYDKNDKYTFKDDVERKGMKDLENMTVTSEYDEHE